MSNFLTAEEWVRGRTPPGPEVTQRACGSCGEVKFIVETSQDCVDCRT